MIPSSFVGVLCFSFGFYGEMGGFISSFSPHSLESSSFFLCKAPGLRFCIRAISVFSRRLQPPSCPHFFFFFLFLLVLHMCLLISVCRRLCPFFPKPLVSFLIPPAFDAFFFVAQGHLGLSFFLVRVKVVFLPSAPTCDSCKV